MSHELICKAFCYSINYKNYRKSVFEIGPINSQIADQVAIPIRRLPQSRGDSLWPKIPISLEIGPIMVAILLRIKITIPAIKQCAIKFSGAKNTPVNDAEAR